MNIDEKSKNNIESYIKNHTYGYIIKYLINTDTYVFAYYTSKALITEEYRIIIYNKITCDIVTAISFFTRVATVGKKTLPNQHYNDLLKDINVNDDMAECVRNNITAFIYHKPIKIYNSQSAFAKDNNADVIEFTLKSIEKLYNITFEVYKVLSKSERYIFIYCKNDEVQYNNDHCIAIIDIHNQIVINYKAKEFIYNLNNNLFFKDIIEQCNNSEKFKTINLF